MQTTSLNSFPWEAAAPPVVSKKDIRAKLRDFDTYRKFLKIRPREGGERVPFVINTAQRRLHALIEEERKTFGMVRCIIPKARRMGVSTYIGSRNFHQVATRKGRRAQVVAHSTKAAANLHSEIKEFYLGLPPPLRPSLGASNAREVVFDRLRSVYKVGSAEGNDISRGDDFHLLHLSEVAFFDNTEDLSSGLLKTVLKLPGTEICMESTGNGKSGMFYNMCEQANRDQNKGEWRCHFLPWHLMPEYRTSCPQGWRAPKEFEDYARLHGLDREQVYWFWKENYDIATMNGGQPEAIHQLTRQEFPATYAECFMTDSTLDYFPASLVAAAMGRNSSPSSGALKLLAVDPAGDGQDKPFVADRQGPVIGRRVWGEITNRDFNVQADWLVQTFDRYDMDAIVIDVTGVGKGLYDALKLRMTHRGLEKLIGVNFAWGANNETLYGNRRAEIHAKFLAWLQNDVSVPNDKKLQEEAAAYKWGTGGCRRDEKSRLFMTPKEKIKAEIGRSPDRLDVCAISMAVEA